MDRLRQLINYLDGKLLKLAITLGITKTVETLINTLVARPAFKTVVWLVFLAVVIAAWVFQDRISEAAENAKEKAVEE